MHPNTFILMLFSTSSCNYQQAPCIQAYRNPVLPAVPAPETNGNPPMNIVHQATKNRQNYPNSPLSHLIHRLPRPTSPSHSPPPQFHLWLSTAIQVACRTTNIPSYLRALSHLSDLIHHVFSVATHITSLGPAVSFSNQFSLPHRASFPPRLPFVLLFLSISLLVRHCLLIVPLCQL